MLCRRNNKILIGQLKNVKSIRKLLKTLYFVAFLDHLFWVKLLWKKNTHSPQNQKIH